MKTDMSATSIDLEKHVEEVPWTLQQTIFGIVFTLAISFVTVAASASLKSNSTQPLALDRDSANAIVVFMCGVIIEAELLIAPLFYASRAVREASSSMLKWPLEGRATSVHQVLGFRSFDWRRAVFWILMFFVAVCLVNFLYHLLIQTFHLPVKTIEQNVLTRGMNQPITVYASLIASLFIAPVCEEVFFRSFILMGLARAMPIWWAIGISSLLFGVAHITELGTLPVFFCIGLALGFLRWQTRSIWPGILLQFLINGSATLLIVLAMNGIGV